MIIFCQQNKNRNTQKKSDELWYAEKHFQSSTHKLNQSKAHLPKKKKKYRNCDSSTLKPNNTDKKSYIQKESHISSLLLLLWMIYLRNKYMISNIFSHVYDCVRFVNYHICIIFVKKKSYIHAFLFYTCES